MRRIGGGGMNKRSWVNFGLRLLWVPFWQPHAIKYTCTREKLVSDLWMSQMRIKNSCLTSIPRERELTGAELISEVEFSAVISLLQAKSVKIDRLNTNKKRVSALCDDHISFEAALESCASAFLWSRFMLVWFLVSLLISSKRVIFLFLMYHNALQGESLQLCA